MRVKLIFEGAQASLTIEPETDQERAMLKAFGMHRALVAEARTEFTGYGHPLGNGQPDRVSVIVRQAPDPRPLNPMGS